MSTSVAIFGGGVAGLSAAHHLKAYGLNVTVYEKSGSYGGKAKSTTVTAGGVPNVPGEHGFRFFPAYYRHLPDTMANIPLSSGGGYVDSNFATCPEDELETLNGPVTLPTRPTASVGDFIASLTGIFSLPRLGLSAYEAGLLVDKLLRIQLASDSNRYNDFEQLDWWAYTEAANCSMAYQHLLGATRTVVAADARVMSARTAGVIGLQLLQATVGDQAQDRVLNGPTNEAWLDHWHAHLAANPNPVTFQYNAEMTGITMKDGQVSGVTVTGQAQPVTADYYVAAVPLECMQPLVTNDMKAAEPLLQNLGTLKTRLMIGIQYYLHHDVPIVDGHSIYLDSAWGLTSISQQQFWDQVSLDTLSGGVIKGCLSVDISDWNTPGTEYTKQRASECTSLVDIAEEVWEQLKAHLNQPGSTLLGDANRAGYSIDVTPAIGTTLATSDQPLFVNTKNSWINRPRAVTQIPNLLLASDYVRTWTDLATMEGANEAARRAVNGILDAIGAPGPWCQLWPLSDPAWAQPTRDFLNMMKSPPSRASSQ